MRAPRPIKRLAHHLKPALMLVLFIAGVLAPSTPAATAAAPAFAPGPPSLCQGDAACLSLRWIQVNLAALGGQGERWFSYDPAAHTAPLSPEAIARLDGEARGVRLILSEVGVDRLAGTRDGAREALGIAFASLNRLNPEVSNPLDLPGYRPYPGCGAGLLRDCLNPRQFLGLGSARARAPGRGARPDRLAAALDIALAAWRIAEGGLAPDPTRGATEWRHRCGGAAYGARTTACDEAAELAAGATAHDGPLVFLAPHRPGPSGAYRLRETLQVPYRPGPPAAPRVFPPPPGEVPM